MVEEYFDTDPRKRVCNPRYSSATIWDVPIIRQDPKEPIRDLSSVRWGLLPSWARDSTVVAKTINARSETACPKPAFRDALKSRRCPKSGGGVLRVGEDREIEAALLFRSQRRRGVRVRKNLDRWKNGRGNAVEICSSLPTTPNSVTAAVHDHILSSLISIPTICGSIGLRNADFVSELLSP